MISISRVSPARLGATASRELIHVPSVLTPLSGDSGVSRLRESADYAYRVNPKAGFRVRASNLEENVLGVNSAVNGVRSNDTRFRLDSSTHLDSFGESEDGVQNEGKRAVISPQNANGHSRNAMPGEVSDIQTVLPSANGGATSLVRNEYEHDLEIATKAINLACKLSIRIQNQILAKKETASTKLDKSLVTVADWGVQAIVSWVLQEAYPTNSFGLIAEEDAESLKKNENNSLEKVVDAVNECLSEASSFGFDPPSHPLQSSDIVDLISYGNTQGGSSGRHWILDPVDGTLGFVRGDQYAVALALLDKGQVVLGVLGCPNLPTRSEWLRYPHRFHRIASVLFPPLPSDWIKGCILKASIGGGTWMQPLSENNLEESRKPKRVFVSSVVNPLEATFVEPVEKANTQHSFSANLAENIGLRNDPLRVYSMAKYAAIARGDAEIFMKFARSGYKEKVWDHAAGVIVVEEAGGRVTDAGGNSLIFSNGRHLHNLDRGIIACCNSSLLSQLLEAVDASWTSSIL